MIDAFLAREQSQLLPRIRPGTTHTADFVKATNRCFEWADTFRQARADLSRDPSMSSAQRKQELARMASEEMLPDLAAAVAPAKLAKAIVEAERKRLRPGINLDPGTSSLFHDAAVVDAALYWVRRELQGLDGVSLVDVDMLTTPGAPS